MEEFKKRIQEYEQEYLEDLRRLVGIRSVRDSAAAGPGAPFGRESDRHLTAFWKSGSASGFGQRILTAMPAIWHTGSRRNMWGCWGIWTW